MARTVLLKWRDPRPLPPPEWTLINHAIRLDTTGQTTLPVDMRRADLIVVAVAGYRGITGMHSNPANTWNLVLTRDSEQGGLPLGIFYAPRPVVSSRMTFTHEGMYINIAAAGFRGSANVPLDQSRIFTTPLGSGRIYRISSGPITPAVDALTFTAVGNGAVYELGQGTTVEPPAILQALPITPSAAFDPRIQIAAAWSPQPSDGSPINATWDMPGGSQGPVVGIVSFQCGW